MCAFGDDSFARIEPFLYDPHRADAIADLDGTKTHLVITAHNGYLVATLQLGDGPLRHEQRAFSDAGHRADSAILAGAKNVPGVREDSGNPDRSRLLIDLPVRDEEPPFLWVSCAIREDQLQLKPPARCVPFALSRVKSGKVEILLLGRA